MAVAQVKGQCQKPGNSKCFQVTGTPGAVGNGCCAGAQCQPYLAQGETFTTPVDWYCQYIDGIASGGSCGNKEGKCADGLTCESGVCTDQATAGKCQKPGDSLCFRVTETPGPVGKGCCAGAQCQPYLAPGETFTTPVDWYCQYIDSIALGGSCGNKEGKCADGLNCISGVCSDQATTPAGATSPGAGASSTTDGAMVSSTGADASSSTAGAETSSAAVEMSSTAPAESSTAAAISSSAEVCDAQAGKLCRDNKYDLTYTCCSPYSCNSITDRSSVCKGENLPEGETCFVSGTGEVGTCASGLICLGDVCTKPRSGCIEAVNGLCRSSETGPVGDCCAGLNGARVLCVGVPGITGGDSFCQEIFLADGANCLENRGICAKGSFCVEGVCTSGDATTTTTTTTTSTTSTTTTTTAACAKSTESCDGPKCCDSACDLDFTDYTLKCD